MFRSGVSSRAAVHKLSLNHKRSEGATKNDTSAVRKGRAIFIAFRNSTTSSCAPSSLSDGSFSDYIDHLSRHAMAHSSPCSTIVIYQTLHTFTGGTTAMRLLYEALLQIGYVDAMDLNSSSSKCAPNVILCNDSSIASSERMFLACTEPKGETLVSHPASCTCEFVTAVIYLCLLFRSRYCGDRRVVQRGVCSVPVPRKRYQALRRTRGAVLPRLPPCRRSMQVWL